MKVTIWDEISCSVAFNACIIFLFCLPLAPSTKTVPLRGGGNNFSGRKLCVHVINTVIKFVLLKKYSAAWVFDLKAAAVLHKMGVLMILVFAAPMTYCSCI